MSDQATPNLEHLRTTLSHLNNALACIANNEYPGYRAGAVHDTLMFLQQMRDQCQQDYDKQFQAEAAEIAGEELPSFDAKNQDPQEGGE